MANRHRITVREAEDESRALNITCRSCPSPIASDQDVYCRHCKIYWEDVENGLWEQPEYRQ